MALLAFPERIHQDLLPDGLTLEARKREMIELTFTLYDLYYEKFGNLYLPDL